MPCHAVLGTHARRSILADVIDSLSEPLLRPVRRIIPLVGGADFALRVLLVLLQVSVMMLGYLQASVLH